MARKGEGRLVCCPIQQPNIYFVLTNLSNYGADVVPFGDRFVRNIDYGIHMWLRSMHVLIILVSPFFVS